MLETRKVEEIGADINKELRHFYPPKCSLSREEWQALKQIKADRNCIIITADKDVAMVMMAGKITSTKQRNC